MEWAKERTAEAAIEVEAELLAALSDLAAQEPAKAAFYEERKQQVNNIIKRQKNANYSDIWQSTIPDASENIIETMLTMDWAYLHSPRSQFLTCDNPVCFFEGEGLRSQTAELAFPISSEVAMLATRTRRFANMVLNAKSTGVKEINRRIARNTDRFLFYKWSEDWIVPFAKKMEWHISRIRPD